MITLKPASYSRAKTVEDIRNNLNMYPEQICNTVKAFKFTMEFVDANDLYGPVGSLSEYYEYGKYTSFEILAKNGNINIIRENEIFIEK
jgi:hypothetical protein